MPVKGDDGALLNSSPGLSISLDISSSQSPSAPKAISKAKSNNALLATAAAQSASGDSMTTIPDPKTNSLSDLSRSASTASKHPDLSTEAAALSDKLINAINYQITLDDTLAHTRHELAASKARIKRLEAEAEARSHELSRLEPEKNAAAEDERSKLVAHLAEEKRLKTMAQQEKREIELELETLTASLFEEANRMVASANRDREAMEKKNQQLREQIRDTEMLLTSQQDQLSELKAVMYQMSNDGAREETGSPRSSGAPPSPVLIRDETVTNMMRLLEAMNLSPIRPEMDSISPAASTTFNHLLKPVCRTDLPAYDDFRDFLLTAPKSQSTSRATSGSYAGFNVMGVGSPGHIRSPPKNGSSSSMNSVPNSSNSHNVPGSFSSNGVEAKGPTPLKDTKFFRRLLVEDIEPALRLDLSPTISWLARRSVLSALIEGSMIVEPIPEAARKLYGRYTSCAICGDARKADENPRTHRMRIKEGEAATTWAICGLCLDKVRAAGDLIGYVRMVREGVVKCGDKEEELETWDELIRLRERLFWARMAGGVVPAFVPSTTTSPMVTNAMREGRLDCELQGPKDLDSVRRNVPAPFTRLPLRRDADESMDEINAQDEVTKQLDGDLQDSIAQRSPVVKAMEQQTSPGPTQRESRAFSKIKIPDSFWGSTVNVLH